MTQQHAEKTVDVLIGLAAAGLCFYVLRTPHLRRGAAGLARTAAAAAASWLAAEARLAWLSSNPGQAAPVNAGRGERAV